MGDGDELKSDLAHAPVQSDLAPAPVRSVRVTTIASLTRALLDPTGACANIHSQPDKTKQDKTPLQYTLSVHPISTPYQYTLSIHPKPIHPSYTSHENTQQQPLPLTPL